MPRGHASEVGERRKQQNGYWTVRTEDGWRFEHHVIMERVIKRPLVANEMVKFRDADKDNLHPDNLILALKGTSSARRRLAVVEQRIKELNAERDQLLQAIVGE